SEAPSAVLAEVRTTQEIMPGQLLANFDFRIEALHQAVSRLVFDCDPALQPYRVTAVADAATGGFEFAGWQFQEGKPADDKDPKGRPGTPSTLTVSLRDAFQGGPATLRISCLAAAPANRQWTSPAMRLRQALPRGEKLKLVVHPDVTLERWGSG